MCTSENKHCLISAGWSSKIVDKSGQTVCHVVCFVQFEKGLYYYANCKWVKLFPTDEPFSTEPTHYMKPAWVSAKRSHNNEVPQFKGDDTTRFGNFIFYYNFSTNSLKFIKVYIITNGISQGRQLWYYFFTKNQHFWENHKKHMFCHFSFKTGYKKIEILKIALELFYWLKTSI